MTGIYIFIFFAALCTAGAIVPFCWLAWKAARSRMWFSAAVFLALSVLLAWLAIFMIEAAALAFEPRQMTGTARHICCFAT